MAQDRQGEGLDVFHGDMAATAQGRPSLAGEDQVERGARTRAPRHELLDELGSVRLIRACRPHQPRGIFENMIRHRNPAHDMLELEDCRTIDDLLHDRLHVAGHAFHDVEFLLMAGVFHHDVEKKAVELRLGQRVGALLLDRILGRQHEEWSVELVFLAARRHPFFLHRLEQRGLRLRRRPVDLVGQQQVGENRPLLELEAALVGLGILLQQLGARDVRGHQVRRELDPLETKRHCLGQRTDQQGLGEPGHAHQQAVTAGEDGNHHFVDHLVHADDGLAQLGDDLVSRFAESLDGLDVFRFVCHCVFRFRCLLRK